MLATTRRGFIGHGLALRRVVGAVVATDAFFEDPIPEVHAVLGAVFRVWTRTRAVVRHLVARFEHSVVCGLALLLGTVGHRTGLPGSFSEILAALSIAASVDGGRETQAGNQQGPQR